MSAKQITLEATGYLDDLEVICESFHQLIPKFKDKDKVLLVLDPPYLCTRQESYKQERYFDLVDFLRLVDLTRPHYLFFSSTKRVHSFYKLSRGG